MIMGIAGACRKQELCDLTVNDIEDRGSLIVVQVPNTKTRIHRTFTVVNHGKEQIPFLEICRRYSSLRPGHASSGRFFLKYKNGRCFNQVVGKNSIGTIPSLIATYLKKENPKAYTGHAFRRTSATLLANKGVDVLALKRHGGWKSSTVAESYVEESIENKVQYANKILHDQNVSIGVVQDPAPGPSSASETKQSAFLNTSSGHSALTLKNTEFINTTNSVETDLKKNQFIFNNCSINFNIN